MPAKSDYWSEELAGPDVPKGEKVRRKHMYQPGSIPKHKRWANKGYLKFVSELPCVACGIKDGTIVPHHLKGRGSPMSGGAGYKASDIFTMPLCFECHQSMHSGDANFLNEQFYFILLTLDKAVRAGSITGEYKPYEDFNVL